MASSESWSGLNVVFFKEYQEDCLPRALGVMERVIGGEPKEV